MSNYEEKIVVKTKEDFNKAIKQKYGTICITGDIYDEIKKEYDKRDKKFDKGVFGMIGSGLASFAAGAFPIITIPVAIIFTISLGDTIANKTISLNYHTRDDMGDSSKEIYIVHDKVVKEIREKYKGKNSAHVSTQNQLEDAMCMNVETIYIERETFNNIYEIIEKQIKNTMDGSKKYRNYKIIPEDKEFKFVKIH